MVVANAAPTKPQVPDVFVEGGNSDPELAAFQAHQASAARPSAPELARTWMTMSRTGVLSTLSNGGDTAGFPQSSVVEFGVCPAGHPIFAVSNLSAHTGDLAVDGRASLTVAAPGFKGMNDGRVTLQGRVREVTDDAKKAFIREHYLAKNPDAFYVDFPDFRWFVMGDIVAVRVVGGFARAAPKVAPGDYSSAKPDPVAKFSAPVCGHMNDDHQADTIAMIEHYTGLKGVESVALTDLDRLGMNGEVKRKGAVLKLRLPFPKPADERKAIKEAIVDMTKAARGAQ